MKAFLKYSIIAALSIALTSCSPNQRDNGWYPVDNSNIVEGSAIATTTDFEVVSLDTITVPGTAFIQGKLKQNMVDNWTEATERRIGKRIGFVFRDSVIMAPTVNCRIESGSFSINSPDKELILEIYNSLDCEKLVVPKIIQQKGYATAEDMTMQIISPVPIAIPVDSIVVEFTNGRDEDLTTGEWYRIDEKLPDGNWRQARYSKRYQDLRAKGTEVCFNDIGYSLRPNCSFKITVKPWIYDLSDKSASYRLVKTFSYPPYPIQKSDTAYVEFQIR